MSSNATRCIAKFPHVIPGPLLPAVFLSGGLSSPASPVGLLLWSGDPIQGGQRRRPHPHCRGQPASATPHYDFQLGFRCFSTIARTKFARNTAAPTATRERELQSREQKPGLFGIASGLMRATQPEHFEDEYDG